MTTGIYVILFTGWVRIIICHIGITYTRILVIMHSSGHVKKKNCKI